MPTIWMSANGTDTADGSTYALAKKTLISAYAAASQGDTIHIVNDGTYAMTASYAFSIDVAGTNHTTNPGLVIKGVTQNGTDALATYAATPSQTLWARIVDTANFITVKGLVFDYTALPATAVGSMYGVRMVGQVQSVRILDCECRFTTNIGAGVTVANGAAPYLVFYDGSSASHAGGAIEVAYCVCINARLYSANMVGRNMNYHHNVEFYDAAGMPAGAALMSWPAGTPASPRRFYNNTLVLRRYAAEAAVSLINSSGDDTAQLAVHSNLLYVECGASASPGLSGGIMDGYSLAAVTAAITTGYDVIALGAVLTTFYDTWTTTEPGLTSYQFNSNFRAGAAYAGTNVEPNSSLLTNQGLDDVFNGTVAAYTWTPNDYAHDLPFDLRPIVGRAAAYDGGVVGAVADGIQPIGVGDTYAATAGRTLTTTAADGVLSNDIPAAVGGTITASLVTDVSVGTLSLSSDGGFTYQAPITYSGTQTFTYVILEAGYPNSASVTVTLNVTAAPIIPSTGGGGSVDYAAVLDSLPFYRSVFKASLSAMVKMRRNDNPQHVDMRHYATDTLFDEATCRVVEVAAAGRYVGTLGGVNKSTGFMLETDVTVSASVVYYNGTTDLTFTTEVDEVLLMDQLDVRSVVINNTSSVTATVVFVAFE